MRSESTQPNTKHPALHPKVTDPELAALERARFIPKGSQRPSVVPAQGGGG